MMRKIYLRTWYFIYLASKYNWSKYLKQLSSELFLNKCPITLTHFATKNTLVSAAFPQKEKKMWAPRREDQVVFSSAVYSSCFGAFVNKPRSQKLSLHWKSEHSSSRQAGTWGQKPARMARMDGGNLDGGAPPEGNAHLGFHASVSGPLCGAGKKRRLLNVSANKVWAFSKDGNLEFPVS